MRLWPAALLSSLSVGLAAVEPGAPFLAVPPSARVGKKSYKRTNIVSN